MDRQRATSVKPPLLWWRFVLVAASLVFLGWGFAAAYYSVPTPTRPEQVIFWLLLALVFLETNQAGWYRPHDPWELRILPYVLQVVKWVLIAVLVVALVLLVIYLSIEFAQYGDDRIALGLFLVFSLVGILLMLLWVAWLDARDR